MAGERLIFRASSLNSSLAELEAAVIKTLGMHHVALRVADVERAKRFYCEVFGMGVVWQPDPDNAYLSSGSDNLALHREPGARTSAGKQNLDHIGFFVADLKQLGRYLALAQEAGIEIVHPLRHHRDGTSSFYIRDPDGIVVQVLHDPSFSVPGVGQTPEVPAEERGRKR